jgi:hypothetical protein
MRIYFIGILVAFLGLLAASQVQAEGRCGLRSDKIFTVGAWRALPGDDGRVVYKALLFSNDEKAITQVGGTVEFYSGSIKIASIPLALDTPVAAKSHHELVFVEPAGSPDGLIGDNDPIITALACVDHISYADGSGVIIN